MKSAGEMSPTEMRAEIFRVARLCAPSLDSLGPLTFHGNPTAASELTNWRDSVWCPLISPAIDSAHASGKIGCRELIEVDQKLDLQLAGPLAKSSRTAGRQLATQFSAPANEPALLKFLAAVASGSSPGHLAILFAARAAVFHIPLSTTRAALLFLEMRASPIDSLWSILETCLVGIKPASASLNAA
jgi:hypothetical protein